MKVVDRLPVLLKIGKLSTALRSVPPTTGRVILRLKRGPQWPKSGKVRAVICCETPDGMLLRTSAEWAGGDYTTRTGAILAECVLAYNLPAIRQGKTVQRIATVKGGLNVWAELELLAGELATELTLEAEDGKLPNPKITNSVAFDAASSGQATSTNTITVSHTSSGSNRAVFVGVGCSSGGPDVTNSVTYGGTAMTEDWDVSDVPAGNPILANSGHHLANQSTGAQNVVVTKNDTHDEVVAGAISMTGVDQTTPIGAVPTPANGESTTAAITVASVGEDDLVVSNLYTGWNGAAPGADQTERWEQIISASVGGSGDTQPGTAGGVMSATRTSAGFADIWTIGAVAFKPSAGGGDPTKNTHTFQHGLSAGFPLGMRRYG